MEAFECNGRWWLPNDEKQSVAGTLHVTAGGSMRLSLIGSLGATQNALTEKDHPIILGSVDKSPKGNEVTLTNCFLTDGTFGSFLGSREAYHVGRGYFGALLPDASAFSFKSVRLHLSGLGEWIHTHSGFERKGAAVGQVGETVPLAFYTQREPLSAQVPGGSIIMGLGLRASFSALHFDFREEAQVKVTSETPMSADDFNEQYAYALRNLMTFVCDRAQTIERFSVWRPDAPEREILVVGELIQPDDAKARGEVSWHEMLFTLKEINFTDFIGRWLNLTRVYSAACNVYFGLMYGPPSFLDMKFQNVANAVQLYYARREDGAAHRASDEQRLREVLATTSPAHREWLVDHLGVSPYPPFQAVLRTLLEKHGDSIDPLITARRDRFVDVVLSTLEYIVRREPGLEVAASSGADLYWLMEKLRFLLKACFLHEVGFSTEDIRRCFGRNAMYQHIYQQELTREAETAPAREVSGGPQQTSEKITVRPKGSPEIEEFWTRLKKESPRGRSVVIAAYFDEQLGQILGNPEESFHSKIMTAHRKGILTTNEHDDLQAIRNLRNLVVHQLGGPEFNDEERRLVNGLKTWRVAVDSVPQYDQLFPAPEDRLLYVATALAVRLKRRGGGNGQPLPEPDFTDVQSWPPETSQ